jgi:hypothetical protein
MTGRQKQHMGEAERNLGNAKELIKNALKQMQRSKRAMRILPALAQIQGEKNHPFIPHSNKWPSQKNIQF